MRDPRASIAGTPAEQLKRHAKSNLNILIVEDEFFIALDVEEQAKSLGHTVVGTAVSAEEAVTMAGERRPDVVLMDIRLSGATDGIAAALAIRSRYGIQSIFVTANTDPDTLARAEAIRPLGVIEKPITVERLRAQLTTVDSASDANPKFAS